MTNIIFHQICPRSVADRVNLGLIPSSECSWPVACAALKPSGGTLHIHGNVETHSSEQNTPQEESTTEICASDELYEEDVSVNCSRSGSRFSNSRLEVSAKTEDEEMEGVDSARIGQNVHWVAWARHIKCEIHRLLEEAHGGEWEVKVIHLEHVKSYAPHVDHMVADVSCRPIVWSG
ncbi:tRNA wybutosine-synthesizing protein 2-like protein [Apostichopus japonicus]|uniref:tRNA wybutosine-synthesizing protein 2-like protein n=1 Tax=Stichopus japonicus TaxID=307972 RepID=A0A2G8JQS7_STIJA|nr:tRNA wybutosine-synthesizing protein 2-like protein [Apostichopus japonicus]